ncbi:hypothetical protein ACGC1H_001255 [Rhizoctonia solani]|uniref:DUF7918 domain-containing protein n=1 Tax=Rhizoctonia solani TaxID=456999 RepID=A0A8H3ANL1_9AGAM|nr:unnamed protein product [Rhizoctonia solani]
MIFERLGLSVRITNSDGDEFPEYQVQETADDTIQCWIPSTTGVNFQIHWEVIRNPHPQHDLRTVPFLDGVLMRPMVTSKHALVNPHGGKLYKHQTGTSTARLYEFGTRALTDSEDAAKPDQSILKSLNTIKLVFEWGRRRESFKASQFEVPPETGPIHEKAAKKSHSGAVKLGKTINVATSNTVFFTTYMKVKPITFLFCYAPEGWLRARDIIPRNPELEPESKGTQDTLKRERSVTPDVIDIDELETDDDEIQIIKHMIPAPVATNKRRRVSEPHVFRAKKEED